MGNEVSWCSRILADYGRSKIKMPITDFAIGEWSELVPPKLCRLWEKEDKNAITDTAIGVCNVKHTHLVTALWNWGNSSFLLNFSFSEKSLVPISRGWINLRVLQDMGTIFYSWGFSLSTRSRYVGDNILKCHI